MTGTYISHYHVITESFEVIKNVIRRGQRHSSKPSFPKMAQDDRTPDFDDLLAAFDIPDVPSISVKEEPTSNVSGSNNVNSASKNVVPDKINCDDKKKLLPTSKLTLGVSGPTNKRNVNSRSLPLPPSPSPPSPPTTTTTSVNCNSTSTKSTPSLTNKSESKMTSKNANNSSCLSSQRTSSLDLVSENTTYQLSTNVLPPYNPLCPVLDKFKGEIGSEGYRCVDCGDRFLLETSLSHHLQRRSVYITFNCESCQKLLVYYNRCNLLNHIRSHREKNQPSDVKKADVTPLPRELMNVIQATVAVNGNKSIANGGVVISSNNSVSSIIIHDTSSRATSKGGGGGGGQQHDGRFRCSECCQFFDNAAGLEDHFGRSQNMPLATSQCTKCNMTCPSKCSLSAHQRIHLQSKPFICPECGQSVTDNWNAFQRHLSVKCLHYSRTIGYKCSICCLLHNDGESLREHIISIHSEVYYKCQACPMAFKAGNTFDTHKKTAHLTMDVECKMIFKCPLCDTVFHSSQQLDEHLDVHIKEQIRATKFVFKCLQCHRLVESKASLVEHMKQVHPQVLNKEECDKCGLLFDTKQEQLVHTSEVHEAALCESKLEKSSFYQGLTKCDQCCRVFQTGHGYNIHKQRCRDTNSASLVCFVCNEKCSSRVELAAHGRSHQQEGLLVCTVCNNHTFDSRNGLAKHLDAHAANMKLPATCDHCGESLDNVNAAAKHLKIEHGFSNYVCDKCEMSYCTIKSLMRHEKVMHNNNKVDGNQRKYVCWICKERDFAKRSLLEKHVSVEHNLSRQVIESKMSQMSKSNNTRPSIKIKIPRPVLYESPTSQVDRGVPHKQLRLCCENDDAQNGDYICFKCDFTSESKSTFVQHIATHKSEKNSLQCAECGTCFVVEPSLRRHLTIVHKVKNIDQYLSELSNNSDCHSSQQLIAQVVHENLNGSSALECSVCLKSFSTDLSLKTHMRTHGMAFIRSNRLPKSSESSSNSS